MSGRPVTFIFFLSLLGFYTLDAGNFSVDSVSAEGEVPDDYRSSGSIIDLFLPAVFRDESALKAYIRSERFYRLCLIYGDTAAIDAIFDRAMAIADGDVGHALLISLLATLDHFRLRVRTFLGIITLPLTTESKRKFDLRMHHLPAHVLPDSLGPKRDDRDKLQHFFGSALLMYAGNWRLIAEEMGAYIEAGEESFVVGGANDERDKFANRLGQEFGFRLRNGENIMPSDILGRGWGDK